MHLTSAYLSFAIAACALHLPSSFSLPAPHLEGLARRAENAVLTVPMKAHELTAGFIYGYSIEVHIASDAQTGASLQPPFSLNVDTGSAKLWVISDLAEDPGQLPGSIYTAPRAIHDRHELVPAAEPACGRESYVYADGTIRVEAFETAVTIGSREMPNFWTGAAFQVSDKFRAQREDESRDDGMFGLCPSAALRVLPALGLSEGSQFVFDAGRRELSFGDFSADAAYSWLDATVQEDLWVIAPSLSSRGATLVDSGDTVVLLPEAEVKEYFAQYSKGTYEHDEESGTYFVDCDLDDLPRLEIVIDGRDFGLDGVQLRGHSLDLTEQFGRPLCFFHLQSMELPDAQDEGVHDGLGAVLGIAWLKQYVVVFDPYQNRIGVRPAQTQQSG